MFRVIGNFITCFFGPRLYRTYPNRSSDPTPANLGQIYDTNFAERWGDQLVTYLLPFGTVYCIWQRKLNLVVYLSILVVASYVLRAAGRTANASYIQFLQVLSRAQQSFNTENAESLRRYDFQFTHWPVSYKSNQHPAPSASDGHGGGIFGTPLWYIGYAVAHTIGIRLIYPGTLFSFLLRSALEDGRAKQVILQRGVRTRVEVADGNKLDTMFFDHRRDLNPNGKTLVICFEGNAGFYEVGMLNTALDLSYSVLGWNHPGFAGSTGMPYPSNEKYAAEAIFDYATTVLGFREQDIVLYAWSIGGFPASYLAGRYPDIKGLILDATFDDILPLALPRMPAVLSGVVEATIRSHVDLRIYKELREYRGPLTLIRRTDDEIIADPPGVLTENRGNFLLVDVIRTRFPTLLNNPTAEKSLKNWLAKSHAAAAEANTTVAGVLDIPADTSNLSENEKARLVTTIADRMMIDYKSTHCTALQPSLFKIPRPLQANHNSNSKI